MDHKHDTTMTSFVLNTDSGIPHISKILGSCRYAFLACAMTCEHKLGRLQGWKPNRMTQLNCALLSFSVGEAQSPMQSFKGSSFNGQCFSVPGYPKAKKDENSL